MLGSALGQKFLGVENRVQPWLGFAELGLRVFVMNLKGCTV